MNTFLYGGNDSLAFKKLKNQLNVKCSIHSIENLEKNFSNLELTIKNFKDVSEFSNEGQTIYQKFFSEKFQESKFKSDFNNILSQSYEGVVNLGNRSMFKIKNNNYEQKSEKVVKNILSFINDKF